MSVIELNPPRIFVTPLVFIRRLTCTVFNIQAPFPPSTPNCLEMVSVFVKVKDPYPESICPGVSFSAFTPLPCTYRPQPADSLSHRHTHPQSRSLPGRPSHSCPAWTDGPRQVVLLGEKAQGHFLGGDHKLSAKGITKDTWLPEAPTLR